ncbi:hypothetical protein Hamer_G009345 [Homarus americanus]|uniref:ER-bound oxygenase mpaB/mpaB'/Rubber oxygenase catalytic domain-containing protein n=2 Tax=Homarus americanus TaxID=6706 RepID=A0A8J5J9V3_HOMAM|nr:hypothetical protein Hamer_G009345 [Homarus americanus]
MWTEKESEEYCSGITRLQTLAQLSETTPSPTHQEAEQPATKAKAGVMFPPPGGLCQAQLREECPHLASTSPASTTLSEVVLNSSVPPSPRLTQLLEGLNQPGDSGNPPHPPQWLDRELFDRGRKFYHQYLFSLCFSELLSLLMNFSFSRSLRTLIYTGRSDTPKKALKRYFSTMLHVIKWFTGDVWAPEDSAHEDILSIRYTHNKLAKGFNSSPTCNEKVRNISVSERGHEEPSNSLNKVIRQDLQRVAEDKLYLENDKPIVYMSQLDMALTQYSFMGLIVTHPEKMGAGAATEEELAGLIHFWRGLGWLLGIDDKYNLCSGSVKETKELCLEVERLIAIPSLAVVDWDYEHMAASLITGIGYIIPILSYPAMFRYLAYTINFPIPAFVSRMSYSHSFQYWVMRMTFALILLLPWLALHFSNAFRTLIIIVQKSDKLK